MITRKNSELSEALEELAQAKAAIAYGKTIRPQSFTNRRHSEKALYFAQCGDAVKIGVSSTPDVRVETLQTGAPGRLTLLAVIPKSGDKEADCHKTLNHLRIHGEWFRYTEEIDALIRELS